MSLVMSLMIVFVSVVTFVPGGGVASASGLWTRIDGGGINANPSHEASEPNATVYGDALFVAWQENGKIRAKKYEGGVWSPVDGGVGLNVDPAHSAEQPKLAVFDDGLYATWSENNSEYSQIRVKKYISDGVWDLVDGGSGLNVSSSTGYAPDLAAFDSALYATWYEGSGYKAQVKKYDGEAWTSVVESPGLTHASGSVNNPKLAVFDSSLFLTWQENKWVYPSPSQSYIPVKRYDGETTWTDMNEGNGLNSDPSQSAASPSMVAFDDRLFATWRESNGDSFQVRVKTYDNGSGWTWADDGGLNANPSNPAISPGMTVYNNSLYAIWAELDVNADYVAQVHVKKYDGTGWSFVDGGTGLNADPSKPAADPILAAFGNGLYAVWAEGNQIRVARYEEGVPSDPNQAPTVSGVTVSGTAQVGQTLAGGYTYVDADHDAEGATTFQWYAADDASGTNKAAIGGATSKTLLLDPAQAGKYISFEVTPVAATGTSSGLPAGSEAVGPVLTGAAMEGSGTEEDPYIVTTAAELDGIRDNLSAHYKLGNDLDLSGYENWMPIGYDAIFLGTFDGDGHVIRGLNINSEINPAGLFAESYGIIRNVGLEDVSVASISSGAYNSAFVGGLIGRNSGTVENSYVTGNVSGNDYVGGLVGYNDVSAAIRNSYAISEVTGGFYVGGLVGFNAAMSDIEEEYRGQISNSYAIGSVGGYDNVGGLVGINHGVLENSYVYGTAGASEGLESPVANNGEYGFSDTSFAKTQDEMRQESTFAGWDFDDIWTIDEGNDYPRLQIFQQSSPAPELDGFSWAVGGAVGTTQATSVPEGTLKYVIGTGGAYSRPTLGSDASVLGYVNDLIRNADIPVLSGQHIYIVEVDADGKIVKWADITVSNSQIKPYPSGDSGSPGSGGSPGTGGGSGTGPSPVPTPQPTEGDEGVAVIVNGKEQARTATAKVTTVDNKKLTTVTVDEQKLNKVLATVDQGYVVTVPVSNHSDVVIGELNARMVKNMESKNAVLEVKTERAGYTLPAMQINVDAISSQIGSGVALEDIKVRVEIANVPDNQLTVTPDPSGNIRIVAPAVDFKITAVYGGKEVTVDRFNAYVERTIAIPDGVDPNKITTGIVVKADGSIAHVPTKVTQIDGVYYATINSLTNSVYSVIYNNKTFEDIAGHWAQNSIENLASRLVVNGADDQRYLPDNEITRAEFAAIVVRALGLQKADQTGQFSDVNPQDWFYEAVSVGSSYGLVQGYTDGKFEPRQNITRQEAMAILTRAMALAGMDTTISSEEQERLLADFADSNQFGDWAKPAAALNIRLGIVIGNQGKVLPQQLITKAETAAIVERLLQAANLI